MPHTVAEELKQTKPLPSIAVEALLDLQLTAAASFRPWIEYLRREAGISASQYNVLRILRGAGQAGARISDIAERMVGRDPDVTRLVDGLLSQGLVERERSSEDRRVVCVRITPAGLRLIGSLDEPSSRYCEAATAGLSDKKLRELIRLLDELRAGVRPFP